MKLTVRIALALTITVLVSGFLLNTSRAKTEPSWPQWRGPSGQGTSEETKLPTQWTAKTNIKWKTSIPGRGHSSPIVWGNKIFLTTAIEGELTPGANPPKHIDGDKEYIHPDSVGVDKKHKFQVMAIDRQSGRVLWTQTAYEGIPYDYRHRKSSYASATPATDGRHVYAYFGSEGLYAYDMNGKLVWKADLGKLSSVGMGHSTSPILYKDLILLQCDEEYGKDSFVIGIDKKTGREVWRTPRKVQMTWATPLLVRTAKRDELITSGVESIVSYDPNTGTELWRHKGLDSNAVPSPVANRDTVFLSSGYPTKIAMAIALGQSGDLEDKVTWKYSKGTAYVPSPILYGDYLYLTSDRGVLTCLDPKTGEVKYEGGRVPVPASFTASPVAFDNKILLTSEDGDTFVVKAGPKHEILATNSVGEPVYASPAVVDGNIFIRGERNLYCIGS